MLRNCFQEQVNWCNKRAAIERDDFQTILMSVAPSTTPPQINTSFARSRTAFFVLHREILGPLKPGLTGKEWMGDKTPEEAQGVTTAAQGS